MKKIFFFLLIFGFSLFAEEVPKPYVSLFVNNSRYENNSKITLRASEKVILKAMVFGGRRSWCMEPYKYANIGKNTTIVSYGEDHLEYTIPPSFKGIWNLVEEKANWFGQLNNDLKPDNDKNTAELIVPKKKGEYQLKVKVTSKWHYKRFAQGSVKEEDEVNEAEASFVIIVDEGEAWFNSSNISASGNRDDDLKFRLESLQERYDLISKQILDGKFELAKSNIAGFKENLENIKLRLNDLKKDNKNFNCKIIFYGTPADKGMKKLDNLKKLFNDWKKVHSIVNGNAQEINKILLNKQMQFSNNILKSVIKNYIDWGSGIPQPNDLFGAVPYNLSALTIPSNVLDWYNNAQEDASILKDQANSVKKLSELREFYLKRSEEVIKENKNIKSEIDKNQEIENIYNSFKSLLQSVKWAEWKP
ncbi:MAG TPA: hypothetical protein VIR55_03205 [Ignavibacteria bacterium]